MEMVQAVIKNTLFGARPGSLSAVQYASCGLDSLFDLSASVSSSRE